MLLPLLLNNLMGKKPTPPTPSGEDRTAKAGGSFGIHPDEERRRKLIEQDDNDIMDILQTFIRCL